MRNKTKTIHMAKHMDEETVKEGKRPKLPDSRLLKCFTVLAEAKDAERIKSTDTLLKFLLEQQSNSTEGICEDVTYAVNRLIGGLTSGRKFARLGYSVALCQLLRSVKEVDTKHVLECMNNKIKILTSANSSKKEQGNAYLGKVFGYLALVHSEKLFGSPKSEMSHVVEELLTLSSKRSYLNHLCLNALCAIIAQVKSKVFREYILPHVQDQLTAGWTDCTPERLCLLLSCSRHHKEVIHGELKNNWGGDDILGEKHWGLMANIIAKSASTHTSVHAVNTEIINTLLAKPLDVVKFWTTVILPLFVTRMNPWPKRILGLYYCDKLFHKVDSPEKLEVILHPEVLSVLSKSKSKKKYQMTEDQSKIVQSVIQLVQGVMRDNTSVDIQLTVMKCLVKPPGSCMVISQLLGNFTSQLLPEACDQLKEKTMKLFIRQPSWLAKEEDITDEHLTWSIHELSSLVTNTNLITNGNKSFQWQLDILQFLFLHSFFTVTQESSDIKHCDAVDLKLSPMVQKGVVDNLQKAVHKLISYNTKGQSRYSQFCAHQDILWGLLQYADTLINASDSVQMKQGSFDDEKLEQWQKLLSTMQTIRKKRSHEEKFGPLHAFELLFIYQGLQMFLDPTAGTEVVEDLRMCYKKSNEKRKSKVADDEPDWMCVITELLVSLMFKDQVLSRIVARDTMAFLSNHVTSDALQIITESLQQTSLDGLASTDGDEEEEEELMGENNDDDDGNEMNIDPDVPYESDSDEEDEDDEEEDEEKEEEESDIEEEPDVSVPEDLKKKLKAALGAAAADEEEEDEENEEEEVELTDKEMFQLDDVLAAAFRSMRRGNKKQDKEKKLQLVNFKIRLLDLLEAIFRHYPKVTLVKEMIVPLLELTERGYRDKNASKLGNSALSLLQQLFKVKSFIPADDVDGEELLELFLQLMTLAGKDSSLVSELAKSCLLVVRILLNLHDDHKGPSPLKTRSKASNKNKDKAVKDSVHYQEKVVSLIQQGLQDMFQHKSGHCPASFFHTVINRYPLMFWSLSGLLQKTMLSTEVKVYSKTQAASILSSMVTKHLVTEIGESGMGEFVEEMRTTASQVVSQMDVSNVKQEFVRTVLDICLKVHKLSPLVELTVQVLGDPELDKLAEMKKSFNHDVATLYRKLTKNSDVQNSSEKKRKKKNKQISEDDSPAKKVKTGTQSVVIGNGEDVAETSIDVGTPASAKKKKRRKSRQSLSNKNAGQENEEETADNKNDSLLSGVTGQKVVGEQTETPNKKKQKKRKSVESGSEHGLVNGDDVIMNGQMDEGEEVTEAVTLSAKKKLRKSNVHEDKFSPRYTRSMPHK